MAYEQENIISIYGDTMYIAGTNSASDAIQNWWKIPTFNGTKVNSYIEGDRLMKENRHIKRIVGHSKGGQSALELQRKYDVETTTYGAPVFEMSFGQLLGLNNDIQNQRFKHKDDPVSMFDFGATTLHNNDASINPLSGHYYTGYDHNTLDSSEEFIPADGGE